MLTIKAGYRAFNGYVFTEADARAYNAACEDPQTTADQRHNVFLTIIYA